MGHLIAKNLVDFANCAILSQEVQNAQNVPHYVLQESTLVPAFARLVKQAVPVSLEVATEFTIESCNYFSKFDCKETCGLCRFCDVPGFDKTRSECSTYCVSGIDACTQTCNAGQARCLEFVSPISDLSASIDAGALTAASTIDSCQHFD